MKKAVKILFVFAFLICTCIFGTVIYYANSLSDSYCILEGESLVFSEQKYITCDKDSAVLVQKNGSSTVGGYSADVKLLGVIPIKTVQVNVADESEVLVLGTPFGIKIYTEGVLVVGFCDVDTKNGNQNPAVDAGIKVGDSILKINGKAVSGNTEVQNIISASGGATLELLVKRGSDTFTTTVTPVLSISDKRYKTGLWIRDSSAGIGTMTFFSPSLNVTAGLGHGICDTDTGSLLPLLKGEFLDAEIVGIKKSSNKATGELKGVFSGGAFSQFALNDITGVFGCECAKISGGTVYPVAMKQEITTGQATVITTVDGEGPKSYTIEIEKVYHKDDSKIKNMVIKITDPELLEKTGGIVQGMSGSPIIQNGKLIGAITHVFVGDSTKGYAIFAENMLETAQNVANERTKEAS